MKIELSQLQRVLVAVLYFVVLIFIYQGITGDASLLFDQQVDSNIWFYSGAFMIVLGSYVVEPFFTKPSDAIANSIAVIIALLGLSNRQDLIGFSAIFYYAILVFGLSVITIALKDSRYRWLKLFSRATYLIGTTLGASKVIFSIVYLSAAYSFFASEQHLISFVSILALWICLTFFDVLGLAVSHIWKIFRYIANKTGEELGEAIGCDNPFLYKVEIDYIKHQPQKTARYGDIVAIETSVNTGSLGIVVSSKHLINKRWLNVYLLKDDHSEILKIDLKSKKFVTEGRSLFYTKNLAYRIDLPDLPEEVRKKIQENQLFANREQFVGYVASGSNINSINFAIQRDLDSHAQRISEGIILKTKIYGEDTLYQVINGSTKEEHLENHDVHGYTVGIARKLGKYNLSSRDLETTKWMPSIYSPLFFAVGTEVSFDRAKDIASKAIGRLPQTDLEIPIKDIDALVTHNTAILGILGIGKSCLSNELIKKVCDTPTKVVCIDITNEHKRDLPDYIESSKIVADDENAFNSINAKYTHIHQETTGANHPEKSGNTEDYRKEVQKNLCQFLFEQDTIPDDFDIKQTKKIRIYNPDYHKVSKGEKIGYNVITTDLSQAEKTRVIAEELFKILMKIPLQSDGKAKVLLVFEEAHSLVPEWNSVANEGDKNATNGTAKVILQGRKYGLGSLVITQRTANVSKSILNQCNTIFAMRVFDDTGKGFLENYFGGDYADTLPTLEERHAIVIGKALRLKQPIIVRLNDKDAVCTA